MVPARAHVVHQEQLGSIEEPKDLTVVEAAVAGTERPSARKRVTTPGTSVRSCRRVVIERKGRNRFGGGRSVKRITRIPAKKNLPVLRPAGEK
jgi:hypothetical protein